jgi:Raf kinase inhibitor-like YbhB/YbcL family protein
MRTSVSSSRSLLASLILALNNVGCSSDAPPGSGDGGAAGSSAGAAGQSGGLGGAGAGGVSASSGSGGSSAGQSSGGAGGSSGAAGNSGGASGGAGGAAGSAGAAGGGAGGGDSGGGGGGAFALTSPELTEGAMFAAKHTCSAAGFDKSVLPELEWTAGPADTKSYAITFIDVTLTTGQPPSDNGYHWVIWNIPATARGLAAGMMDATTIMASQNRAYLGPCPNFGGGTVTHDYEFKLYALAAEKLTVSPATGIAAVKDAEAKLEAMHLAVTKLSGKSMAAPP